MRTTTSELELRRFQGALSNNQLRLERRLFSGTTFFSCDLSFGAQPMFSIFSIRATLLLPDGIGSLADSMFSPVRHLIPSWLRFTRTPVLRVHATELTWIKPAAPDSEHVFL